MLTCSAFMVKFDEGEFLQSVQCFQRENNPLESDRSTGQSLIIAHGR